MRPLSAFAVIVLALYLAAVSATWITPKGGVTAWVYFVAAILVFVDSFLWYRERRGTV